MICNVLQTLFECKIENNEIGGACSTYEGEKMCIYRVLVRNNVTVEFVYKG